MVRLCGLSGRLREVKSSHGNTALCPALLLQVQDGSARSAEAMTLPLDGGIVNHGESQMNDFLTVLTMLRLELGVARFLARWADFGLVFLIVRLLLRPLGLVVWQLYLDWYSAVAISAVTNAISVHLFGTTLWKSALGLHVRRRCGGRPRPVQAFKRELLAVILGMGCGIPILATLAAVLGGWRVLNGRRSIWNRTSDLVSVRTDFLERLVGLPHGRAIASAFAILAMVEFGLVLFVAARYEPGWIITGL